MTALPLRPALSRRLALAAVILGLPAFSAAASKSEWPTVDPSELSETKPTIEADAPAEIVQLRYDLDDTDVPRRQKVTEYLRFKIFDPIKAADVTRLSSFDASPDTDEIEVHARLTLPNGHVQEFGKETVQDRAIARDARAAGFLGWLAGSHERVREKFLAVPGIERGAILEYRVTRWTEHVRLATVWPIQRQNVPVRSAEFVCRECRPSTGWFSRTFVFNGVNGHLAEDHKTYTLTYKTSNVPSIAKEPLMGPLSDYSMCVVMCYEAMTRYLIARSGTPLPSDVDPKKHGPWAFYSTMGNWFERDRARPTRKVKQLAAEITSGLTDERAKARAIHNYVRTMYQDWRRRPAIKDADRVESLDDVIDIKTHPRIDRPATEFLWLAIALYQSAGLQAHLIWVPDRALCRFRAEYIAPAFLQHQAIAVKIAGEWKFSEPQSKAPLPFGMLPWNQEGQPALLALDHEQQFLSIPLTPSDQSVINNVGQFSIDIGGTLTGELQRSFTGQTAVDVRSALLEIDPARRHRAARNYLGLDLKTVEVRNIRIAEIDDPEKPLVISAQLRWPGFAQRTKERLLVRPAVLEADGKPPFAATERRYPATFHHRWREVEKLKITVPDGFTPEAPTVPPALDATVLYHRIDLAYDHAHHTLHVTREFKSDVIDVAPKAYPAVKEWFDVASAEDKRDVVFIGKNVPMPEITAEPETDSEAKANRAADAENPDEERSDDANSQ